MLLQIAKEESFYIGVQDRWYRSGIDDPDGVALQISNMVRDAIKPDVTMFLRIRRRRARKKISCG